MQTTHVDNVNTHAVIGGGQAVAFKTAQTAEFFEILSSTLYSDKPLAFAREVICNAWDSHIMAGKTNVPVEVNIDTTNITIRDFGVGIPDNKMVDIYCVYGNSTKENDGLQTGGFGLGSKAPFAYTKNFAVTSYYGGMKSLYNISRGSTATNGVPDMRLIVAVPTTETGLMVSVPTGQESDVELFKELFRGLCQAGGILAKINGTKIIPYDYPTDMPFMIMKKELLPKHLANKPFEYYVKYGSVLYPVDLEKISNKAKIRVSGFRGNEGFSFPTSTQHAVILVAPSHSIGVTPSRESLSYTTKTLDSLRLLLEKSNKLVKDLMPEVQKGMVEAYNDIFVDNDKNSLEDYLKSFAKAEVGYDMFVKNIKQQAAYSGMQQIYYPINDRIKLVAVIVKEALSKGTLSTLVSDHYINVDPKGIELRKLVKKLVRQHYPSEDAYVFKMLKREMGLATIAKMEIAFKVKAIYDQFKKLDEMPGVTVRFKHTRYASEDGTLYDFKKYITPSNYRYNLPTIVEQAVKQYAESGYVPILIAPSIANRDRAIKRFPKKMKVAYAAWAELIVPNKATFDKVCRMLKFTKAKKFWDTREDGKLEPRPVITNPEFWVMNFDEEGLRQVVKHDGVGLTHFMPVPGNYMIVGKTSPHETSAKINLDSEQLDMVCYLFPNVVLSSTSEENTYLESIGMENILQTIAREATEYFSDPKNLEAIMSNMSVFARHFSNYNLSRLLGLLSPAQLMESLNRIPTSYGKTLHIPSVCHLFASLNRQDNAPRYGMQYCHKAAADLSHIFTKVFDLDMEIISSGDLTTFLGTLPDASSDTFKKHKAVYQTVAMSAVQHTRVQIALQKMRKKP